MVKKSHLKPPSRGLARMVYTAENFNLHILFCNDVKLKGFWIKLANSPQTGTQAKESKINFKSQLKYCEFLRVHGQLANLVFK
jgi:hypothetical protein